MDFLTGDFVFRDRFAQITDEQISSACQEVLSRFAGVMSLWKICDVAIRDSKRKLCYNYLVAWLLTNQYPDKAVGVSGTGGMPLKAKKIADVSISYNMPLKEGSLLASLTTNSYGIAALEMIQTAPENFVWVT